MRYLSGTKTLGILLQQSSNLTLTAFSDADWASNLDDRKSVAAYCVFLGESLVSWSSKKQAVVARSSTESEYRAEIIWLQQLLSEIGISSLTPPILWCDNLSAGALAVNPVFHARTKHIEIDIHFVRDRVLQGLLDIRYVPSSGQLADCLTKPLPHSQFHTLRSKLGVLPPPSRLREDIETQAQDSNPLDSAHKSGKAIATS